MKSNNFQLMETKCECGSKGIGVKEYCYTYWQKLGHFTGKVEQVLLHNAPKFKMLCTTIFANTSFDVVFVEIFLLVQCGQILEKRVAQIFPKLPKQYPRYFYLKSDVFQNCLKFLATYLCKKFVTKSFKNRPIWSHWLFLTPLIFF